MTYKALYTKAQHKRAMAKTISPIKTMAEYKLQKSRVNRFERESRAKNPRKHAVESKRFLSAILKTKRGKGKK